MPSAVEALPCGSRSMTSTRSPPRASAVARFTAVVVLPTPPFWLAMTKVRRCGRQGEDAARVFHVERARSSGTSTRDVSSSSSNRARRGPRGRGG